VVDFDARIRSASSSARSVVAPATVSVVAERVQRELAIAAMNSASILAADATGSGAAAPTSGETGGFTPLSRGKSLTGDARQTSVIRFMSEARIHLPILEGRVTPRRTPSARDRDSAAA
jgi:hypothetical protein